LDVGVDATGKASVGASRYITRNTRIGVRTGAKPEDSAVTMGVDLTRRLRAQGEVGADGKASVGVGFEWDY
jgi:translocation and assembly module TamB